MVRVSSTGPHSDFLRVKRQIPLTARRGHAVENQWGWCDLPIRLSDAHDEYGDKLDCRPYELQVMMTWGSWKAMMGMMSEGDVVEGMGVRVGLALARENPETW